MKTKVILSIVVLLFLWSCATTMKYTWKKDSFEGKKFNNVLVMGITKNLEARSIFENTVVNLLKKEGINAVNSLSLFPPVVNIEDLDEEKIESKVRSGNYDAVLVSSLVNVNEQNVYEQGTDYYPVHFRYRRYIYSGYGNVYDPGYYHQEKNYVLETRLFDVAEASKEEAIVWSGQSSLTDPSSYESGSKEYAKVLVNSLLESGTIK